MTSRSLAMLTPTDRLPACATRRVELDRLEGSELDALLADGWYRIGQAMTFCDFVAMDEGTHGVIWTRVPLATYRFRKSLRRIQARVERDFVVRVHPRVHSDEHEALYERYLTVTSGARASTLESLCGGRAPGIFDTWEVSVRDRGSGELVAFSWFDRGARTLQSITGVYAPEHRGYSLGFYTMLREIQFGLDVDLDYFYAGYVLCGDEAMDYKLRTGGVEVLDRRGAGWRALEGADLDAIDPLARTRSKLNEVARRLDWPEAQLHVNDHFSLSAAAPNLTSCLAYHLVLSCSYPATGIMLAIAWDTVAHRYELLRCIRASLTSPETGEVYIQDLLVVSKSLGRWDDIDAMLEVVRHELYAF